MGSEWQCCGAPSAYPVPCALGGSHPPLSVPHFLARGPPGPWTGALDALGQASLLGAASFWGRRNLETGAPGARAPSSALSPSSPISILFLSIWVPRPVYLLAGGHCHLDRAGSEPPCRDGGVPPGSVVLRLRPLQVRCAWCPGANGGAVLVGATGQLGSHWAC